MFKMYPSGLIGYSNTGNAEFSLYGTDSESQYKLNLKAQPNHWHYRNNRFDYQRNDNGHRSVNIEDLSDDFILFAGCSFTEGIGVSLENSYAYIVAKHFNMSYYNLSLNGAGPDLVAHNLGHWFTNIKKKPKYVVIQWPSSHRVFYKDIENIYPLGPWSCKPSTSDIISKKAWHAYESMVTTDFFEHYSTIFKNTLSPLLELSGVKVFQYNTSDVEIIDYGRDLAHPGIISHLNLADTIIRYLEG